MSDRLKRLAQETLGILNQGFYINQNGVRVDISELQENSEDVCRLITPAQGKEIVQSLPTPGDLLTSKMLYEVVNVSTVQAILDCCADNCGGTIGALNFASARNPGGGFLRGTTTQEESLAYSSGLYNTLIKHPRYYEANRAQKSMTYTDYAIYSPDVVFFRDAEYNLLDSPVTASILTLPAVNMSQVREKGEHVGRAMAAMKDRMRLALSIFASERVSTVILGAYGCGVFGNNPRDVANWWRELLYDEELGGFFGRVLFAIFDRPDGDNLKTFRRVFGE